MGGKVDGLKKIPEDITPVLAELKARLVEFYGERLVKLVLFGSRARGDNDADSDIDVLVVLRMSEEELPPLDAMTDLELELWDKYGYVLNVFEMDEWRFLNRQGPLLRNIRREGAPIE